MNLLLLLLLSLPASADESVRICYFSLNEEKEFEVTRAFMDKLNAQSSVNIEVQEFQTQGGNPQAAFKKMVESGVRCDGLVISGHHTGSWGGHRAKGKLSMDFIEGLSCDPKYADWFRNVNAAWLQGCRTLGVGEIAIDDEQADADFHTNRVGQVVEEDGLAQTFAELNQEFSSTLDQDNPLASRYLRMFPSSKLFGWTRSAPGEKSRSWMSVLYHIAHIAKKMDAEDQFPDQGPDAANLTPENAARYADAVMVALQRSTVESSACEDIALEGWLAHGNVGGQQKYYFDNPDLKSMHSLASTGDHTLLEAKKIDCLLKMAAKNKDLAKMNEVLDLITSRPDYLRYSFNTIVDLRNELGKNKETSPLAQTLIEKMKAHLQIRSFLAAKMGSRQVGVVRKIEYYQFFRDLTGGTDPALEEEIQAKVTAVLLQPLPELNPTAAHPERSRNLAASYRTTVFQALVKNKMAGYEFYNQLLQKNPEADVLKNMALQANTFSKNIVVNPKDASRLASSMLLEITYQPKLNAGVANAVIKVLSEMKLPPEQFAAYRQDILGRLQGISENGGVAPPAPLAPMQPLPAAPAAPARTEFPNPLRALGDGLNKLFKPKEPSTNPRR